MPEPRQIDLEGRVALVTGGSRGIGFGIAERLLQAGARLALAARTPAELERARQRLGGGERVTIRRCDLSVAAEAGALVESVVAELGRLDVLVCSHGVYAGTRSLLEITPQEWESTMATNVGGSFFCAQAAARAMIAGGRGGRIILISSMNALASLDGAVDYDTSKAAMHGLTRAMAVELAQHGITVNSIAPGWIRTEMSEEELAQLQGMAMNPGAQVGEPADVARAALWLADPENSFMNGSVVVLDGGQTAMLPLPWPASRGTGLIAPDR